MSIGEFCTRVVAVVNPHETVLEAAKIMREHHVGDVIVVERQAEQLVPVGIVTDRDIVIEIVAKAVSPGSVTVGDMMSRELLVARESDAVSDVVLQMRQKGVRRVPVVNTNGGLEGIFSLDDLLELVAEEMNDFVALVRKGANQEARRRV